MKSSPPVLVFGHRALKKIITLKGVHTCGPQTNVAGVLMRKGDRTHTWTDGRPHEDPGGKWPFTSQEKRPPEKAPADPLILDFQPPEP